jgi:RNA polymerase sigma factor (sigma-70 family)
MIFAANRNQELTWYGLDLKWVYSDLLRTVFYRTKCIQTAYDVLHDAMLRFVLSHSEQRHVEPHAYMRVVVRNLLVDHYHQSARFVSLDVDDSDQVTTHYTQESWALSPAQLLDLQQRMRAIEVIINGLPHKCREVFWLYRIEGITQSEIAAQLSISINMVERHVIRALVDISAARELLIDLNYC